MTFPIEFAFNIKILTKTSHNMSRMKLSDMSNNGTLFSSNKCFILEKPKIGLLKGPEKSRRDNKQNFKCYLQARIGSINFC